MMKRYRFGKRSTTLAFILTAALTICLLPGTALAASAQVGDDASLQAAMSDAAVTEIELTANVVTSLTSFAKTLDLGGYTLSVPTGAVFSGAVENGGISVGSGGVIYASGALTNVTCDGAVYVPVPGALSGASALFAGGGFGAQDQIAMNNGYYDSAETITGAVVGGYYYDVSGATLTPKTYFISYYYGDGKNTPMNLSASYPKYYIASTSPLVINAAPDQTGYAFSYWAYNGVDSGKTFRIAAGTMANITLYSYWNAASGTTAGSGAATGGMAAGISGGGGGGGATGLSGAVVSNTTTDDDDEDDTVATASVSPQGGGMRVRNASSTTRHSFDQTDGDVEARISARRQKRFPWQWVGVGLGGAVLLLAVGVAIRRRLNERDAATLEKLHIRD